MLTSELNILVARALKLDLETEQVPDFCGDWSIGGPVIEKYKLKIRPHTTTDGWVGQYGELGAPFLGDTPLIAAMKALVVRYLGLLVD